MAISLNKFLKKGKMLILTYDQGLEHGPTDFNDKNVNPEYILDIALEGNYTGVIMHNGLAEKYYYGPYRDVPLILKINGKTNLTNIDPISRQLCSVERAIKLGASAIGYTIYDGSPEEPLIFSEFGKIVEQAHDYGIPVFAWMYPRGPTIGDELNSDLLAYSARVGLELGADVLKMKYNKKPEEFKWVVKSAGRCKIVISDGYKQPNDEFLETAEEMMTTGVSGLAVARNIFMHDRPYTISKALKKIIIDGEKAEVAKKILNELK
jgi:fructose-bisphosphate aldolase, class I